MTGPDEMMPSCGALQTVRRSGFGCGSSPQRSGGSSVRRAAGSRRRQPGNSASRCSRSGSRSKRGWNWRRLRSHEIREQRREERIERRGVRRSRSATAGDTPAGTRTSVRRLGSGSYSWPSPPTTSRLESHRDRAATRLHVDHVVRRFLADARGSGELRLRQSMRSPRGGLRARRGSAVRGPRGSAGRVVLAAPEAEEDEAATAAPRRSMKSSSETLSLVARRVG